MRLKKLVTSAAALGLVATPVFAQAADAPAARASTTVGETEGIGGASNVAIAMVALAAYAVAMYLVIEDDDDDDMPVSP